MNTLISTGPAGSGLAGWVLAGAVVGFLSAAVLRTTVFRLSVPSGEPPRTTCLRCATGVSAIFRCPRCHVSYGVPLVLEFVTAAVAGLLAWRFAGSPAAPAFVFIGVIGVALAAVDISVQRLPNRLTVPLYPGLIVLFGAAALLSGRADLLLRAIFGGLVLGTAYLILALVGRGQLGGGDVKLAGGIGIALGWLGWPAVFAGAALGFVLMAVVCLALLAARRITLRHSVSFGPFMLAGALVAVLLSAAAPTV
ncbi:A24 family peptidase [Kribbella yunnanensis]|uniref:A24 family peptidase n=1 Tax=Kribbella yunnanensis TaxID=190194 RepID=A0ABP4S311_9ACTN